MPWLLPPESEQIHREARAVLTALQWWTSTIHSSESTHLCLINDCDPLIKALVRRYSPSQLLNDILLQIHKIIDSLTSVYVSWHWAPGSVQNPADPLSRSLTYIDSEYVVPSEYIAVTHPPIPALSK